MPIKPEDITSAKLPTAMRGYQREATDELLKTIAWDFRQAVRAQVVATHDLDKLKSRVSELEQEAGALREALARQQLDQQARLETEVKQRTSQLEAELEKARSHLGDHERREELTHSLLANAQRTARELRDQAREECEALVKAARKRATEIEEEARDSLKHSAGELDRLQRLEHDLRDQLRRTLESVLREPPAQPPQPPAPAAPPQQHQPFASL